MVIKQVKSSKRFLQKVAFVLALLGWFVLLDPTSNEDGCPMETSSILQPDLRQFNFTSYLNTAREGFIGRKWLFDRLEDILDKRTKELSAIIIVGEPGSGKSAIAAQLICSRSSSLFVHKNILGYHLCKHLDKMTQDGGKFVKNLVDMIARRIPRFMEIISSSSVIQRVLQEDCSRDPHGCFEQAIVSPLKQLRAQSLERNLFFIVVDAIDECTSSDSGSIAITSSISELIRHKMVRLPSWLKLIITSRNDSKILKYFPKSLKVELFPSHASNMDDIELFITKTLYEHSSLFQKLQAFFNFAKEGEISSLTSSLLRQSQGNFLYVKELLHYRLDETLTTQDMKSIPPSIGGIYYNYFQRAFKSDDRFRSARNILEVLVATLVPLSQEEIYKVLCLEDPKLDYAYSIFLDELNGLSHFLRRGEGNTVSLFHLSLLEWLIDENNLGTPYFVDKKNGHRALASYYFKKIKNGSSLSQSQSFIFHLAQHIAFSGRLSGFYDEFQKLPTHLITQPVDETQRSLLHLAAAVKNVDVLRLLLPFFPKPADVKDNYGVTPAFVAATQGALKNLELLLEVGANIFHRTNPPPDPPYEFHQDPITASKTAFWKSTLLHVASQNGHLNVVKFLLLQNVSLSERDGVNFTALQLAAQNGHLEVVTLLHESGAQTDQVALYHAAANGHDDVVKFLLQNVGVKDECMRCDGSFYWLGGKTRYQAALIEPEYKARGDFKKYKSKIWDMAQPKHLKQKISNFRFVNDKHLLFCQTALHAAVLNGHIRVVQALLLQSDNALHCTDFSGRTPLHDAVRTNNIGITELLLRAGANISQSCRFYQNLTSHFASRSYRKYDHLTVIEEYQYNSGGCPYGSTPMHLAARYGHSLMAALLERYGASLYTNDFQGATLLHVAACQGQIDFIQWLISSSTMHVNTASDNGSTPLHSAAVCGRFVEIPILIGLGANITSQDNRGMTALHYTALIPSVKSINGELPSGRCDHCGEEFKTRVLSFRRLRMWISSDEEYIRYEYFFDKNVVNENEIRVLPFDRQCKTARRLMELMDVRAVNRADNLGGTALHLGAKNGLECIVGFLLANSALPRKENNAGLTPLEETIQTYDPLGTFDAYFAEAECEQQKRWYETFITQTECVAPSSSPSMEDLTDYLLNQLDYQTAVVHILFAWELEIPGPKTTSMLHRAIEERQPHLVLLFLLMGADVNQKDSMGRIPLLVYLQHGGKFTDVILQQFEVQVPVTCGVPLSSSPFHMFSYRAALWSKWMFSEYLEALIHQLSRRALVSKCFDAEGYIPLHRAAQGGNIEAIETFLSWGVDVSILSRDGHSPLFLAIKDAGLKTDPWSVDVDTTKASKTAIHLFRRVLRKTKFKIKCDGSSTKLTVYHLAAYRGLHEFLHQMLGDLKPPGFNIDCPDKFGVTPLYLAKLFAGFKVDGSFDPWKKIVRLIESYGGALTYPDKGAEFRILYTHLFDTSKQPIPINITLAEELLQLIKNNDNLDKCFRMFHAHTKRNDTAGTFFDDAVLMPYLHYKRTFEDELFSKFEKTTKMVSDYYTLENSLRETFQQSFDEEKTKQKETSLTLEDTEELNLDTNDSPVFTFMKLWQKLRKMHGKELFKVQQQLKQEKSVHNFLSMCLSHFDKFLSRNEKLLSDFLFVKALKSALPALQENLECEKIAVYKDLFLRSLRTHFHAQTENWWMWKRNSFLKAPFMLSRLPLILILDLHKTRYSRYSPFEAPDLVQLIKIVLHKRSKFDYLDVLAFGNDRGLWNAIHRFDFYWNLRSMEREENMKTDSLAHVKLLVKEMKEGVIEKWKTTKAKEKEMNTT